VGRRQEVSHPGRPARQPGRRPPARNTRGGVADWGIVEWGLVLVAVMVVLGWPAMVWHGKGGPTGNDWRWDIHSTIAEGVYLGIIGLIVFLAWLGNRLPADRAPKAPPSPLPVTPPATAPTRPGCRHAGAVKVDAYYDETVVYCCWCPDCDKNDLPANFRRPCCGTEPGNPHWYSCPEVAGT
jgi:hypothetical protein